MLKKSVREELRETIRRSIMNNYVWISSRKIADAILKKFVVRRKRKKGVE